MKVFLLIGVCSFSWAEWDPSHIDPHDPHPPVRQGLALGTAVNSGVNYQAHIPSGTPDFEVVNLGKNKATFMLIMVRANGEHHGRSFQLGPDEERVFSKDLLKFAPTLYLISMQNFGVRTQDPGQVIPVQEPRVALKQLGVETPDGQVVTVGVDESNKVHYPVYGTVIGQWELETREVTLKNGVILTP